MTFGITYRQATAFDLPVFVSLDKELFPYSPWSAAQYKEEFSSPTRHFVVATDEAQSIIGYAGVFAPGDAEADILTVGVVPDHRGKGIAKALMALITDWAKAQGSTAMMLEVKTDNKEAIGLYESLGYSQLNVRKDYFGVGLDAQVMRLELS
jgi:ribosomal-protein-alanine N-acetyltransferase